jgi:hypothetical protein
MRKAHFLAGGLACLALVAGARVNAESPPSRLMPAQADVVFEVQNPRQLVETVTKLDTFKQLLQFPAVKEVVESTKYRRFQQLVAYYERELGAPWPELLDRLAGGGAALGIKLGDDGGPALLVVQGKDEAMMKKFVALAVNIIEQELNREEAKAKLEKSTYDNVEVWSVGPEFRLALSGKVLLASNNETAMRLGLDLVSGKEKKSIADRAEYAAAAKLLPKEPMAKVWLNLEHVHKNPQLKELFKTPREPVVSVVLGHYLDVFSRSLFVCASFSKEGDDYLTTFRLPAGRDGMGPEKTLHIPAEGKTGSRPLLEPKGVIYSNSFHLDVAKIWEDRVTIFGEQNAKALEKADKDSGKLPFGNLQLSTVLTQAGAYHRFVVASQPKVAYKKTPKTGLPAFAFVTEMRDPDAFSKTAEAAARAGALLGLRQFGLKLAEEKYRDLPILAYRFDEETEVKQDVNDIRFNFTPCLVRVGNQLVICTTVDLCHELIDLLQEEAKAPAKINPATSMDRVYAAGVADILDKFEEQLVTQGILDQAIPVEEAKEQVQAFIKLVHGLGTLTEEIVFEDRTSRLDFRAKAAK